MDNLSEQTEKQELESRLYAHGVATALDLAYVQYSTQWQKIGTMQQSAGIILTVISIVASLMLGIISQIEDTTILLSNLGVFSYSFYTSIIFSFLYLVLSGYFVFQVIKPKVIEILEAPNKQVQIIIDNIKTYLLESDNETSLCNKIDTEMLLKLNSEIENTHQLLKANQQSYNRCLKAASFSFIASILALLHTISDTFFNSAVYITIVGILGYFSIIGIVFIFVPLKLNNQ